MLPPGRLKDRILSLTGQPGRKRIKLNHLNPEDNELVYRIVRRKSLGIGFKDQLLVESVEHTSLVMRNDYDEKPYMGNQRASFMIHLAIVCATGNGTPYLTSPPAPGTRAGIVPNMPVNCICNDTNSLENDESADDAVCLPAASNRIIDYFNVEWPGNPRNVSVSTKHGQRDPIMRDELVANLSGQPPPEPPPITTIYNSLCG